MCFNNDCAAQGRGGFCTLVLGHISRSVLGPVRSIHRSTRLCETLHFQGVAFTYLLRPRHSVRPMMSMFFFVQFQFQFRTPPLYLAKTEAFLLSTRKGTLIVPLLLL